MFLRLTCGHRDSDEKALPHKAIHTISPERSYVNTICDPAGSVLEAAARNGTLRGQASRIEEFQRGCAVGGKFRRPAERIHIFFTVIDAELIEDGCGEIRYFDRVFGDVG